ncbi:MAG: FAD/NAD(P)-binding protein [Deltaproteobacteria bacterium]|nr:FAD/NAD(P)-binding protein [Deltaproteobacteria bacterium]
MKKSALTKTTDTLFTPQKAKIIRAVQATQTEKHFTLALANKEKFQFMPGQILEVSLFGFGEIPIGIASSPTRENTFDIVVRTVGRVSAAVNKLDKGDHLFIRGPLGKGFPLDKLINNNVLIVAGGIGLCPTRSLIQYILDRRTDFKTFTLFYGTKTPEQQMFLDDLKTWRLSKDVHFFETVDVPNASWQGHAGLITKLFKQTNISSNTRVVLCGPPVMFKFVIFELKKLGIIDQNIFLDLERRMKCGVGKCGHCQINNKYVCTDGPVFALSEIRFLEEAL